MIGFRASSIARPSLSGLLSTVLVIACMVDGAANSENESEDGGNKGGKSSTGGSRNTGGTKQPTGGTSGDTGGSSQGGSQTGGTGGAGSGGTSSGSGGTTTGSGGTGVVTGNGDFEVSIALWRGDARGAYTMIHDDLCGSPTSLSNGRTAGLLNAQGMKAAFGAIAGSCGDHWGAVKELVNGGHEVINHSWDHTDHVKERNLSAQVDQATNALKSNVGEAAAKFYIFPFDSYDQTALDHLRTNGYLGARGGKKGLINAANFPDDFKLNFDVFGVGYSAFCDDGVCAGEGLLCCGVNPAPCEAGQDATGQGSEACRVFILDTYVDQAIAERGWAIREFHGVDDGWEPVPQNVYEKHLTYLKTKISAGELWVDTPTAIIKYRRAREYCKPTLDGSKLSFASVSQDCAKYQTPLTAIIKPKKGTNLSATQGGTSLEVTSGPDGTFLVQIDPAASDVTLSSN